MPTPVDDPAASVAAAKAPASPPTNSPAGSPPTRSKIAGGLAALACALCCTVPFLIAAGVLTAGVAAVVGRSLLIAAAGLAVAALGMWWHYARAGGRRR